MPAIAPPARRLFEACLAALWPADCLLCRAALPWRQEGGVCIPCWGRLPWAPGVRLRRGARRILLWGADYSGPFRTLIHLLKFGGIDYLAPPLGDAAHRHLAAILDAGILPRPDCVVPVPLHWTRRARRGYNQAEGLARSFSRRRSIPLIGGFLSRIRAGPGQVGLGRLERRRALDGCFRARRRVFVGLRRQALDGMTVLLVDDVVTTGATLEACATALLAAGAAGVVACAVARTALRPKRRDPGTGS